jgi:hypothetical protein
MGAAMNGYAWLVAAFRFHGGFTGCVAYGLYACRSCNRAAREVRLMLELDMPRVKR